jgi:hypothetical protein
MAELEKELLALRMMGQVQNVIPDAAAHVPEVSDFECHLTTFGMLWSFV